METKQRAHPMPPEDRRRAIVEAVIPLVIDQGANVTTAQMARAAGIAEGTIFRVFPDKTALLHAAVKSSLDPAPALVEIGAIDRALPIDEQLTRAAEILLGRSERVHALIGALRSFPRADPGHGMDAHRAAMEANSQILRALTALFAANQDHLAIDAGRVALTFRALVHALNFPLTDPGERLTIGEVVEILLHGVATEEAER